MCLYVIIYSYIKVNMSSCSCLQLLSPHGAFSPSPLVYLSISIPTVGNLASTICRPFRCSVSVCIYSSIRIANHCPHGQLPYQPESSACVHHLPLVFRDSTHFQSYLGQDSSPALFNAVVSYVCNAVKFSCHSLHYL